MGRRAKAGGKLAAKLSNEASSSPRERKLYASLIVIRTSQPLFPFSLEGTGGVVYLFPSQCHSGT